MSIFDKFKNPAPTPAAPTATVGGCKSEVFIFESLPESLMQLQARPEAALDTPFQAAALTICALCAYAADKNVGIEMLNFLRGPRPLSPHEISFLDDRFRDGQYYVPFSYFEGATPANDYTPNQPFTLAVESDVTSAANEGYMKLLLRSGGADSPRNITLRMRGDGKWLLWEQFVLVGIRTPKSKDPWA